MLPGWRCAPCPQRAVQPLVMKSPDPAHAPECRTGLTTLSPMSASPHPPGGPNLLTAYFWSGDRLRSRSVSDVVLCATLDVPVPSARLSADWHRETSLRLALEPGDVEELSMARSRMRWPDYRRCVQAVAEWMRTLGLRDMPGACDIALMACHGARYHHDGAHHGAAAFCNLFMSEDRGLDLHFPGTGRRIPLVRGTAVIFDTGQPHGVIARASSGFDPADFPSGQDFSQVFLTWELPVEDAHVGAALGIALDIDPAQALLLDSEQVWHAGAPARVCPDSGRWCPAAG